MIISIDFEETYDIISITSDFAEATFNTFDNSNNPILIKILLIPLENPWLPNVYNLAFGPPTEDGLIDDKIRIKHQDLNKLFSTIILYCLNFLQQNQDIVIGLDGSDDTRAHFYHRIFFNNKNYLLDYFVASGVDCFVRLLRNGKVKIDDNGNTIHRLISEPFDYQRTTKDLYWYYMFELTKRIK